MQNIRNAPVNRAAVWLSRPLNEDALVFDDFLFSMSKGRWKWDDTFLQRVKDLVFANARSKTPSAADVEKALHDFPTRFELARTLDSCNVICIGAESSWRCRENSQWKSRHCLVLVAIETRKSQVWCRNPSSTTICRFGRCGQVLWRQHVRHGHKKSRSHYLSRNSS
jgi:hypothetical protein